MFPELPTDNLYKFMALGGLTLSGFFCWLFWKYTEEYSRRVEALTVEHAELQSNAQAAREKLERAKTLTEEERKKIVPAMLSDLAGTDVRASAALARRAALDRVDLRVRRIGWATMILTALGFSIATAGFYLWYVRVQQYQDVILRATADSIVATHRDSPAPQHAK
jgi:hypothetical protein